MYGSQDLSGDCIAMTEKAVGRIHGEAGSLPDKKIKKTVDKLKKIYYNKYIVKKTKHKKERGV